jgi:hypothetical protein
VRLETSLIVAASMSKTRQERQEARLEAALKEMPLSLKTVVSYGATDYSKMFELLLEAAESDQAGCRKTATQLCRMLGLDTDKKMDGTAFLTTCVERLLALPNGSALGADKDALRSQMKGLLRLLLGQAEEEARALTRAGRLSPDTTPSSSGSSVAGKGGEAGQLWIKDKKDREDERIAKLSQWEALHPETHTWPAALLPSRSMVLAFDKWPVAASCPNVRKLSELIEKGRAQTVPAGRESYLLDLISVMLAMRKAYAEPMPEGFKVDRKADLTMLEWTLDEDDPADPSKKKTEKRPAQLSGKIVDAAILHLITALEPLTEKQKIAIGDSLWNELVSEIAVLNGYSLSRAVARVFGSDSRVWQDACKEERSPGRRARKTSPPEEDDEESTPPVKRARGGGKGRGSPQPRGRDQRPVCPDWEKKGTCDAKEAGKCGKRHNHAWANLGKAAFEKKADK